jgi:hypothetical protein
LNAKRIPGADGLGGRAANHRQSTGGQQSQNDVTHENLSSAVAALLIDSLRSNPSRSSGFPSTHVVARSVTGISIRDPAVRHREKGIRVSVFWRGGEVDTIFGFEEEADALQWIKEKSLGWLVEQKRVQ